MPDRLRQNPWPQSMGQVVGAEDSPTPPLVIGAIILILLHSSSPVVRTTGPVSKTASHLGLSGGWTLNRYR